MSDLSVVVVRKCPFDWAHSETDEWLAQCPTGKREDSLKEALRASASVETYITPLVFLGSATSSQTS
jgi:hypothetical protein